jgi:hypothetical protein
MMIDDYEEDSKPPSNNNNNNNNTASSATSNSTISTDAAIVSSATTAKKRGRKVIPPETKNQFDNEWFPLEWLAFLFLGPLSQDCLKNWACVVGNLSGNKRVHNDEHIIMLWDEASSPNNNHNHYNTATTPLLSTTTVSSSSSSVSILSRSKQRKIEREEARGQQPELSTSKKSSVSSVNDLVTILASMDAQQQKEIHAVEVSNDISLLQTLIQYEQDPVVKQQYLNKLKEIAELRKL